jgi:hypothetical protein
MAIRRVLSAPGLSIGEVTLVEQSRPELIWHVDIILGVGSSAVLSGRWRAYALSHHLLVGVGLVFLLQAGSAGGLGPGL